MTMYVKCVLLKVSICTNSIHEKLYEYRDILEFSTNSTNCYNAMKSIRRYLTQSISLDRIQNIFDLGIQGRIKSILETPGYDDLKVSLLAFFL